MATEQLADILEENQENVPPPKSHSAELESDGVGKQRKKRLATAPLAVEMGHMMETLRGAMVEEIRASVEQLRQGLTEEIHKSLDVMWTKMEPLINDQSRSIVALADALDDLTMKEQEALTNPQAESGGPAPEPAKEVQAPEPRREVQAPESAQDLPDGQAAPSHGVRRAWVGSQRQQPVRKAGRLNYLMRQLEREIGGAQPIRSPHPYWENRRGGPSERRGGGRGGGAMYHGGRPGYSGHMGSGR
uniref:Glycine-rich protein 2-like n=1 Tax=Globodera pallida TaxID=36090 RepID=A0A183BPL4_GLOPA